MDASFLPLFQLVAGVGTLTLGADLLVRGASALARRVGLSPLVIGLTVVAFGTSMPEISVSMRAAWVGNADVALGNALGSNIFNILVILGGSAVLRPLIVDRQLVRVDVPVMIATALLVVLLSLDGRLAPGEGLLLVGLGVVYTAVLIRVGTRTPEPSDDGDPAAAAPDQGSLVLQFLLLAAGLTLLVLGAHLLVSGAQTVARALGISELVIGLTVVAAGTSLPELATSLVAAVRGQRDIAVGNVVGSNIFNALLVLGGAASITGGQGIPVPQGVRTFDLPVMLAASAACLPIFFTGWRISRWEGWVFLGYYAAYVAYLALTQARHAGQETLGNALLFFALPLTVLTLGIFVFRQAGRRAGRPAG
jgi:cation:H+ antiporter